MNESYVVRSMYDYFKLAGKSAIVTGAGNGIGAGIAETLSSLGVNVVACDIDDEALTNTVRRLNEAGGTVTGRAAILAEGDALRRSDIVYLAPLPVFNADGSVKE